MAKFSKKPVVIEAFQFKKGWEPTRKFEEAVCRKGHWGMIDPPRAHIHTLEGPHYIQVGDWIIEGVAGEFYPCKPEIFAQTYEPQDAAVTREREAEAVENVQCGQETP